MEQLKAFIVKFVAIGILTFSVFGIFFEATIGRLLLMTLVVAGITFIMDLFVLPRINQVVAVAADFAVLFLLYWGLGNLVVQTTVPLLLPAFTAAYFGTLVEAIYHIYVMDRLHEPDRAAPTPVPVRYQTEFSEESDVESAVGKENEERED